MGTAGQLLRGARRRAGLSQAELARRANVARTVVNAYERGSREPGVGALEHLLVAAGCRLRLAPAPSVDVEHNARILEQLLDLADQLPTRRRRSLAFPSLRHLGR